MELFAPIKQFLNSLAQQDLPLAFIYAVIWIPSLIFLVGLQYYSLHSELPPKLKLVRKVCLGVVVTLPAGLYLAAQSLALHAK